MTNKTTIVCSKIPLKSFAFREVVTMDEGNLYLENVNVLFGTKIIKKIRFAEGEKPYVKGMGKEIAIDYLKNMFVKYIKDEKPNEKTIKTKVNHRAADKTAKNLFSEIGITI